MRSITSLPFFDPYTPEYEADPHAVHRELLAAAPVVRHPFGVAVLGYGEVQTVLRDRRFATPKGLFLRQYGVTEGPVWDRVTSNILDLDGDEHHRLRRLVAQSFTPRTADRLRDSMRETMRELLAESGDRLDVVDLVRDYPIAVIGALLGVPRSDWSFISRNTEDVFRVFLPSVADDQTLIRAAMEAMDTYVDRLVARRRQDGLDGEDLVTQLIRAESDGDRLTLDELRMLVASVLGGGTDTTRNQFAAAIDTFLDNPQQWVLLRQHPHLIPRAVDEVLRYAPIVVGVVRMAVCDTTIGGVELPAGTLINVVTAAANRDATVFPDPDRFDITRQDASPALTFGGGIHYCLGVHLAKAELAEALTQTSTAWATIERAGPAPWKPRLGISGPTSLPITVSTAAPKVPVDGPSVPPQTHRAPVTAAT